MLINIKSSYFVYILSFLIAVIVFVINFYIKGPMIQGDEGSYLANAAAIAGFPNDMFSSYHAGYSLLISPAFLFADSSEHIWSLVKAINALLLGSIFLLIYKIVEILLPSSKLLYRTGISLLIVIYPMWITMSGYSFSENAFVPTFLLAVLLYLKTLKEGGKYWIFLGLTIGFLYWIHPKSLAVVLAFLMSLIFLSYKEKKIMEPIMALASLIFMILLHKYSFIPWLQEQMLISGQQPSSHYPSLQKLLSPFESLEKLKRVIAVFAGHVFYLSLGTLGIIWVGIDTMYQKINGNNQILKEYSKNAYLTFFIFLFFSFVGTLTLSSLFMEGANRLDHWMYGRYVEGVLAPILLLGLLSKSYRGARLSVIIAFIATLVLYVWMGDYSHTAPFNVSTFWQEFFLRDQKLWIWLLSGSIFVILVSYLPRVMAQLLIGVFFIFSTSLQIKYHTTASSNAVKRADIANYVKENYKTGSCVGFDHSEINSYNRKVFWFDLSFALYDYRFQRLSAANWLESCDGPLFSYSKDLHKIENIYPLAISGFGGPILWAKGDSNNVDTYPLNIRSHSANAILFLWDGWNGIESSHVWSTQQSLLNLPIPQRCHENQCSAKISFSVFAASKVRPVQVNFNTKDNMTQALTFTDQLLHNVLIPLSEEGASQIVTINIPNATSPNKISASRDTRVLGIALRSVELIYESKLD